MKNNISIKTRIVATIVNLIILTCIFVIDLYMVNKPEYFIFIYIYGIVQFILLQWKQTTISGIILGYKYVNKNKMDFQIIDSLRMLIFYAIYCICVVLSLFTIYLIDIKNIKTKNFELWENWAGVKKIKTLNKRY